MSLCSRTPTLNSDRAAQAGYRTLMTACPCVAAPPHAQLRSRRPSSPPLSDDRMSLCNRTQRIDIVHVPYQPGFKNYQFEQVSKLYFSCLGVGPILQLTDQLKSIVPHSDGRLLLRSRPPTLNSNRAAGASDRALMTACSCVAAPPTLHSGRAAQAQHRTLMTACRFEAAPQRIDIVHVLYHPGFQKY